MKKYSVEIMNGSCAGLGKYDSYDEAYNDVQRMISEDRSEGFADGEEHLIYAIKDMDADEIVYSQKA